MISVQSRHWNDIRGTRTSGSFLYVYGVRLVACYCLNYGANDRFYDIIHKDNGHEQTACGNLKTIIDTERLRLELA